MPLLRPSFSRGHANHGWLDTYHTFSFANYYDPDWVGFGPLVVINEDRIAGGQGFGEHGHENMEILTYVIEGTLEHKDSIGNGSLIHPDEIQYMSAGTGILHSEFNTSDKPVHLLQIWIEPNVLHAPPRYEQRELASGPTNQLQLLASSDGRENSIAIRQDADVYRGVWRAGEEEVRFDPPAIRQWRKALRAGTRDMRKQWIQVISGELMANDVSLSAGDGCGFEGEEEIVLNAKTDVHFLFFDLAT